MIFYLTLNDTPSGIYNSQVIDVVKYLNSRKNANVKLLAFISLRNFFENRKKIKSRIDNSIVLPMFPSLSNWKLNRFTLYFYCLLYRPSAIIGRSVLATQLALSAKKKKLTPTVCYDGRGAIAAEWTEYKVVENEQLKQQIENLEKEVVNKSNHCIAVSHELVKHWKEKFGFSSESISEIPCTLSADFCDTVVSEEEIIKLRKQNGYEQSDVILIYSGSSAGWQSFELLIQLVKPHLLKDKNVKLLFLSELDKNISNLIKEFPQQVKCLWVKHEEMPKMLLMGDYGLLVREQSITNKVASPVKFAEYLSSGLSVVISENLGDYSEFVKNNNCGMAISVESAININFNGLQLDTRKNNIRLANTYFNKISEVNSNKYNSLLNALKGEADAKY